MSSAGEWVRVIIGGLIVTVVGYFCIQAISSSPNASPTPTNTTSSPVRSGPPSSPSAPTKPFTPGSGQLPEQLTGTWKGSVFQASTSQTYPVTLELARMPGTAIGTSSYPTLNCEGMLRFNDVSFDTVVITEYITVGASQGLGQTGCGTPDQITLKYIDKNHLLYTFAWNGNPIDGQATLARSAG
jgi:hypothetical protein